MTEILALGSGGFVVAWKETSSVGEQVRFQRFAAGGGKLAAWDAEPGHHVEIVPEPAALVLTIGALAIFGVRRFIAAFRFLA